MNNSASTIPVIKVREFQTLTWREPFVQKDEDTGEEYSGDRQIILLYALGEDGIIYEYANGGWLALTINKENMRKPPLKSMRR